MNSYLDIIKNEILDPAELDVIKLEKILHNLSNNSIDYADLYFQSSYTESWHLEDGIVSSGAFNIDKGVGLRAVSGEKTGYAYSEELNFKHLLHSAQEARSITELSQSSLIHVQHNPILSPVYYGSQNPLQSFSDKQKIDMLQQIDKLARSKDSRVKMVEASLSGSYDLVLIVTNEGQLIPDIRPLVRLNVSVIIEDSKQRRENSYSGGGGRFGYEYFIKDGKYEEYVNEAVRIALLNLDAVEAPAGLMPVVLGSGWPGVLLHEAVGHGLEGDFNRKGSSVFTGKIGQKIASDLCTIVDNGTLMNHRGSLNVDDEGTPTQNTTLIENGILKNYMQDKLNSRLMNSISTGNGRRESYADIPMPRMTNTYMLAGNHEPQDIIASVDKGVYAVGFNGGQVDITSGQFVFVASEAYMIENGKITKPIKNVSLIGQGIEVLNKVSMVGNDLKLDTGVGTCGKDGQNIPVCVGQPTIKLNELTVGGTNGKA